VLPLEGKTPRNRGGLTNATTDPEVVAEWWCRWPTADIGIRTGAQSGLIVLDVDTRKGGSGALVELERRHGKLPATAQVLSGGGGQHIYFRHPGREVRNSAGRLGAGLDVRGDGGYVVVPPSVHESGRAYTWRRGLERGLADCPAWLVEDAERRRNGAAAPVGELIPAGRRNAELASIAGTLRRRGLATPEILSALREVNRQRCRPPLADDELARIAGSIGRYPTEMLLGTADRADRRLDDIGNAVRFADQHADAVKYVPAWGRWLRWDGRRWADDDVLEHLRRARKTARALVEEAAAERDEARRKALLDHARRSAGEPRLRAILAIAASDERIVVRPADLDSDPWVLNAENGTIDLHTGKLRPHQPDDLLTMLAGAAYDPDAAAPLWEAHLRRWLVSDDVIDFFRRLCGVSALGLTLEHLVAILWGGGGNGKSVTRNAVAGTLGDYAHHSTLDLLLQTRRSAGQATPELADLRGRRLVTVSESPEDGRLASERVKAITGGDPITARRLHSNPFTFPPSHTIWLSTNHRPRIADDGDAIWRRVLLIPFKVTIPEAEWDREIDAKLAVERPGILAWIVQGALAYKREGLSPPHTVKAATAGYREDEDAFAGFLRDRAVVDEGASAQAAELLRAYNEHAAFVGSPTLSANALAEKLQARNFTRKRTNKGARWYGLRLATEGTIDWNEG
jgi:putative DNA primase/helicase